VHLVEAVRDVDDRGAVIAQAPQKLEQPVDLLLGESCARLVEDQHPCLVGEGARDFHHLAFADAERPDDGARVQIDSHLLEHANGPLSDGSPVHDAVTRREAAEGDVLGNRQRGRVLELLVDHSHPRRARRDRRHMVEGAAADLDGRLVRLVVAGEDLHEGRLPRPVLAEQGEDRALGGVEVHSVQDLDTAEGLADAPCTENRCHWRPSFRVYLQAPG
jgi:hypothetical protein